MKGKKNIILQAILWVVQGCIVGIGAILPGVSGGTLCYAFGIYNPIIEVLSHPFKGIKKYWKMLIFVFLGVGVGFVGFAGVTNWLLGLNVGLLNIGTEDTKGTPLQKEAYGLLKDAGEKGRNKFSIIALLVSFAAITAVFYIFKNVLALTIEPNFIGWLLCGLLWGLSFIVPGFSSSTLLLFFGIYEKMSEGISRLDFSVLIPLGIAMLATLLLFSKLMEFVFDRFHSVVSHCVLGFVVATTLMILPSFNTSFVNILVYIGCIACGAVASFFFSKACNKIKAIAEAKEN